MALIPSSCCWKANSLTVYENQCFIARNSMAETLLLGDSIIKGLTRYKGTWYKFSLTVLISGSAEIAQKIFFWELSTCQICLI